ncbi:hypothetical protein [Povalibacter sp.]|uniref:D-alanyl-D-alanine carboxypeptidase family protein n=1 Tax=Povalibacter sp. TaxID=1962978 RepID=UPI002F427826
MLITSSPVAATSDPYPDTARSYVLVLDGKPLWQREPALALQPASLTKLLTALVVLESDWDPDRWLTVSATAAATPPTRLGLRAGEQVTAGAALAAMLIRSANDACRALVESAAPDVDALRVRMKTRAAALGMKASTFIDPCGFDAPGQRSTVIDLLKLAQAAHAVPLIAALVATPQAELVTRAGRRIRFANTNHLLGRLDGTVGLKTGYTSQAGQCLIAYTRRDGHDVWLVMLGGTQRWWQAHGMINDAFATVTAR